MATLATDTRPFAPFEWMLAPRYLRARAAARFHLGAGRLSFPGILLGVFTLITVMAVMNGFRKELFSKILGLNGHTSSSTRSAATTSTTTMRPPSVW
jgi:lipoprotein-releasing system permease protein